jgi:ubiquinone/menaquinone biosynthesis C-methylase UbiE
VNNAPDPTPDPTARFSSRVDNYVKHRPGYPDALLAALREEVGLSDTSVVADVGSGTGISTALLLRAGCHVYAVEPNANMREAAERRFADEPRFHSVAARAEATGLPDAGIDVIAAGTAFHWFHREETRREFARIIRPGGAPGGGPGDNTGRGAPAVAAGRVALFWNVRRAEGTPLMRDYEQLLRDFGTDYAAIEHRQWDDASLEPFFGGPVQKRVFDNEQILDYDGLAGRLLSASYAPPPGHPAHLPMLARLRRMFEEHQQQGRVRLVYDTTLYFGPFHVDA